MRNFSVRFFILLIILISPVLNKQGLYAQDGAKLFKANCASCHKPSDKRSTGPGLLNVKSRWPDQTKLFAWVKNSAEFLKTGDSYANNLFKEYQGVMMPAQNLTDAEIIAIIDWADKGGDAKTATADGNIAKEQTATTDNDNQEVYQYILIGIGIVLLLLISILGNVRKVLQEAVNVKAGIPPREKNERTALQNFRYWASNNKKLVALLGLFTLIIILRIIWNALLGIGVYQGYAPEQPIKFSHKIHAGDNKINCQYCHTGVEKSRHAVIPSANVCMNCHKNIQEGPEYGTKEIGKIYAALDYNPETQQYGNNPKPIKWIRVHSLPDHAFFSHAQHVKVGKIECAQCHGPVDSMAVVSQYSPLTMGWCINCHRETEVTVKDNGYYEELHKQFINNPNYKKGDKFTVNSIGGLECSKCHY